MADKYQLYPKTTKQLASELKRAVDDYSNKQIPCSELRSLIDNWSHVAGRNFFVGPNQFSPTISQRLGKHRLALILQLLNNNLQPFRNPFLGKTLSLTVGFPLSGKSTLCQKCANLLPKTIIVCPDSIRLLLHGKQYDRIHEQTVWSFTQIMVKTLLEQNFSVIIDATNINRKDRMTWIKIAHDFGLKPVILHIPTSLAVCRERNRQEKRLDDSIITKMAKKYEPPSAEEGDIYSIEDLETALATYGQNN